MKKFFATTILAFSIGMFQQASPAKAEQILQLFPSEGQGCTSTVKINLADAIRSGIDAEVLRAEDALKKPLAIDALGCLDNLMNLNLDIAIPVPDLEGLFNTAVSSATDQLCAFANDKLGELTAQISAALQLPSFNFLPIGGLTGNSSTGLGGVQLNIGGGAAGGSTPQGQSATVTTNLDAVYNMIYGGN